MSEYVYIYDSSHHLADYRGRVIQHRKVAQEMLGRELFEGEVVHHIDGDKRNNDPTNLIVFKTQNDHIRWHQIELQDPSRLVLHEDGAFSVIEKGKNGKMKPCNICGIKTWNKFCSIECETEGSKIIDKPDKETLVKLIIDNGFSAVGRMFNVSDNAVRFWCKKYGLPRTIKELKALCLSSLGASNSPGGMLSKKYLSN